MPTTKLANIKQGENESLKDYIHRFSIEATKVRGLTKAEHKMAITAGVRPESKLWGSMLKREVSNLEDFFERAQKYIRVEEGHKNLYVEESEPSFSCPTTNTSEDSI